MTKKQLILLILILFLTIPAYCQAVEKGELGDESWTVETRADRVFYFTHGAAVWGHEFGFFKDKNDCESDTFWLTFSSSEERVKDFIGKEVVILLDVDGKDFKIKLPMLSAGTIAVTHVMMFTNWSPDKQLIDALMKGRYVTVRIVEPKELEALLDIKDDQFGLKGFAESRKKAMAVCKNSVFAQESVEKYLEQGVAYDKQGDIVKAIDSYSKAIEADPNRVEAYYARAMDYYWTQEYDKAWADVNKVDALGTKVRFPVQFILDLEQKGCLDDRPRDS